MQRSSETDWDYAALAKAKAQLVNPEKSLVATVRSDEAGVKTIIPLCPAVAFRTVFARIIMTNTANKKRGRSRGHLTWFGDHGFDCNAGRSEMEKVS